MDSVQSPATDDRPAEGGPPDDGARLKQGATVGNRFVIDEQVHVDVHGAIYRAVDEKSGKTIAILMMDPALIGDRAATDRLRTAVKGATEMVHKNVVGVFGMGKEGRLRYVAREFVDGQTLADLLEKKATTGKQFTLKGAYNLIAHVCNGLQYGRERMAHGTLRPSVVLINRLGRVKVADFGFAELRGAFVARRGELTRWDAPCFPDADGVLADDLHALGTILYCLLGGTPPKTTDIGAEADARLPVALAAVVRRCLVGAAERFADPNELKGELLAAIDGVRGGDASGIGTSPGLAGGAPASPGAIDEDEAEDEDAVQPAGAAAPKAPAGFVIPELRVAGTGPDDGTAQRWLVERDGVDFGPFSSKQIVDQLFKEEIGSETVLFDIETDRRLPMSEFDVFSETIVAWIHEKDQREKRRAEEAREAAARRRTRIVLGTILAIVVLVGGGFGGWFWYQSTLPVPVKAGLADLVTPIKSGLPAVNLPEELPETAAEIRERREREAAVRATRAAAAERAQVAREEALAANNVLDAAATGGGSGEFQRGAFDRAVASRQGQMFKCLQDEVRRDPSVKSLTVEITVLPSGELINVKMPGATSRGESCVRQSLRGLRVPSFAGTNVKVKLPFQFQ